MTMTTGRAVRAQAPSLADLSTMKTVFLAGGFGTRLAEETAVRPKPMVEIGGRPILWHIMRYYAHFGARQFVVALGYKGEDIKRYFLNYRALNSSVTVHLQSGQVQVHDGEVEDWVVDLVDTGVHTMTGGRIKRLMPWIGRDRFLLTYGDGVANLDLRALVAFHQAQGRLATVTAVRPPARFGGLVLEGDRVAEFVEKPQTGEGWINGGFFVLQPEVLDYIEGDESVFERQSLERLAADGQLSAFRHEGFWQCVDTRRDLELLETLWKDGAPWKVWR